MMRLALLLPLLFTASPALAFDDPSDVIWALYTPFINAETWEYVDPAPLQSAGLNGLMEQDRKDAEGEIGRLDFDPYIGGQDFSLSDFEVGDVDILGVTARITVTFKNFGSIQTNIFSLVLEPDGWKIDDVANLEADGDVNYSLRQILSQPFP